MTSPFHDVPTMIATGVLGWLILLVCIVALFGSRRSIDRTMPELRMLPLSDEDTVAYAARRRQEGPG